VRAVRLSIEGMHSCEHARSARSALAAIPGVQKVEVRLESGEAGIWYDPDKLVPRQFQIALFVMGFALTASTDAESDVVPPPDLEIAAQPVNPTAVIYDCREGDMAGVPIGVLEMSGRRIA
jgi:copper chaperone CopZ